jgi:hypothetical protein
MRKETPCHLGGDDLTGLVHLVVQSVLMVKPETDATEVMLDDRKGLFDGVVVGGIGREVLDTTA